MGVIEPVRKFNQLILMFIFGIGVASALPIFRLNEMIQIAKAAIDSWPIPVMVTGQTNSYFDYDDGYFESGTVPPVPRFTVQSDTNVVLDNATGLMWARDMDISGVLSTNWEYCINFVQNEMNTLGGSHYNYGGYSDWRLPNMREYLSLVNWAGEGWVPNAMDGDHPFLNPSNTRFYWASTSQGNSTNRAHMLRYSNPDIINRTKVTIGATVWAVRGPD